MENNILSTADASDLQQPRPLGTSTITDSIPSSDTSSGRPYISSNMIDTDVPPSPANPTALSSASNIGQGTGQGIGQGIGQSTGQQDKKRSSAALGIQTSTLEIKENPRDRLATVRNNVDIEPDHDHTADRYTDKKNTPSKPADSPTVRYTTPINIYRPSLLVPRLTSLDPYDVVDYLGVRNRTDREETNRLKSRVDELEKQTKPTSLSITISRKTAKSKPKASRAKSKSSTKSKSKTRSTTKSKSSAKSKSKTRSARAKSKSKATKSKPSTKKSR